MVDFGGAAARWFLRPTHVVSSIRQRRKHCGSSLNLRCSVANLRIWAFESPESGSGTGGRPTDPDSRTGGSRGSSFARNSLGNQQCGHGVVLRDICQAQSSRVGSAARIAMFVEGSKGFEAHTALSTTDATERVTLSRRSLPCPAISHSLKYSKL